MFIILFSRIDERHKCRSNTYTVRDDDDVSIYIIDSDNEQDETEVVYIKEEEPSITPVHIPEFLSTKRRSIRRSSLGNNPPKWKEECSSNWMAKENTEKFVAEEEQEDSSVMDSTIVDMDSSYQLMDETPEMRAARENLEMLRKRVLRRRKEDRKILDKEVDERHKLYRNMKSSRRARFYKPKRTGRNRYLSTLEENPLPAIGTNFAPESMDIYASDVPTY